MIMRTEKYKNLFIHSNGNNSILYRVDNEQMSRIAILPFPAVTKYAISEKGWIAAIKFKRRIGKKSFIYLVRITEKDHIVIEENIDIPYGYFIKALAIKNNTLLAGGFNRNSSKYEIACLVDLTCPERKFHPIEIPSEYRMKGKAIDEILIYENRMILVDNVVFPKFLFEYDITIEQEPLLKKVIKLPNNGTYEHIISGQINENWIALSSSSIGQNGQAFHINILDAHDYSSYGTISSLVPLFNQRKTGHWFSDYALSGNYLLLACGNKDLGICKIKNVLTANNVVLKKIEEIQKIEKISVVGRNVIINGDGVFENFSNTIC